MVPRALGRFIREAVFDGVQVSGADSAALTPFARVSIAGLAIDRTRNALLPDVSTDDSEDAGIALYRVTGSRLVDGGANRAGIGILLNASSNNRLQRLVSSAHTADGLAIQARSNDNVVVEATSSNNLGDGVVVAGRSDGNKLLQILSRRNAGSGVLVDASLGTMLMGVTAPDNAMHGIELNSAQRRVLASLVLGNNGADGLFLSAARDHLLMDIASAHNDGAAVSLAGASIRNRLRGELRVGNNGEVDDCVVEDGPSELLSGCAMSGASDAVPTFATSFVDSWPGPLLETATAYGDVDEWLQFASQWRAWGTAVNFSDGFTRCACSRGELCLVWDARLLDGDTGAGGVAALAEVLPLPTVDDQVQQRMRRVERSMPFARAILGDFIGDDDGLCEADEDCLAMPHLGAFQGEGEVEAAGELRNGVQLYRYPLAGAQ